MGGKELDLSALYVRVVSLGGFAKVSASKLQKRVLSVESTPEPQPDRPGRADPPVEDGVGDAVGLVLVCVFESLGSQSAVGATQN